MRRLACSMATIAVAFVLTIQFADRPANAQSAPASGGPVDGAILEDLVAANRILASEGILDAYGHVSIRHPGNPNRYLMSRSLAPILVAAQDIIEYDLDSNPVDPSGRVSVLERFIQSEANIGHSPAAVAPPWGRRPRNITPTQSDAGRPRSRVTAIRTLRPDYPLWRDFVYEYEPGRMAIDVINGGCLLRDWVDDPVATLADLDALAIPDERAWQAERRAVELY